MTAHRIYFCDLRNWTPFAGIPKPGTQMRTFASREEAVAFRATLPRDPDYIVTMTAAPPTKARRHVKPTGPDMLGGRMNRPGHKFKD